MAFRTPSAYACVHFVPMYVIGVFGTTKQYHVWRSIYIGELGTETLNSVKEETAMPN